MKRNAICTLLLSGGLLAAATLPAGCDAMAYTLYLLWPGAREKTVEPQYAGLDGNSVAIVIYADKATEFEYFDVRTSVARAVLGELEKHVEGVEVIDPARVVRYQRENIYWDEKPKVELGKAFGADYVLFISLLEFSTREPGSPNLFRGRITAQVDLYRTCLPERQARVWGVRELRIRYPQHDPTGQPDENDRVIRERAERIFAEKLVRNFYEHKVPIE